MTDPLPPGRDFLASLSADARKLRELLRLWREVRLGIPNEDAGRGPAIAQDATDLIDQLRAQLHAAQLQLADELREHRETIAARRAEVLAAKPRATRGRPAALRHEHERARRGGRAGQEAPH
jgi:hypothetical protein